QLLNREEGKTRERNKHNELEELERRMSFEKQRQIDTEGQFFESRRDDGISNGRQEINQRHDDQRPGSFSHIFNMVAERRR
ncbi:MAG: hypothetical protein AB7P04_01565, partial [Bacteriovoracia bacterium]